MQWIRQKANEGFWTNVRRKLAQHTNSFFGSDTNTTQQHDSTTVDDCLWLKKRVLLWGRAFPEETLAALEHVWCNNPAQRQYLAAGCQRYEFCPVCRVGRIESGF